MEPDPDLERKLYAAIIGDRQPGPVTLVDYDPDWPRRFEAVRDEVSGALGEVAKAIEHIGSTAVPGLAAKPIIDVLVTVESLEPEAAYLDPLIALGYELRVREEDHRMFRPAALDVNLHACREGSAEAKDYLLLRDQLRSSDADREAYEQLKRELAPRDWPDINYYAEAKGPLIAELLARARES